MSKPYFKGDVALFKTILLLANGYPYIDNSINMAVKMSNTYQAELTALYIIDANWHDILGDEWISNYKTRYDFFRYYEQGLVQDAEAALQDIKRKGTENGIQVQTQIKKGVPQKLIFSACSSLGPQGLLIIPIPLKHSADALNIRPGKLIKQIRCPLLTVPEAKKTPAQ